MRFWKRHREDEIERLLRANRADPRDEFVASQLERLDVQQQRFRPQRLGRRVLVATAVTALVVGAGAAAGATGVAGTSISNLVHAGQSGAHAHQASKGNGNANKDEQGASKDSSPSAGDKQYSIEVCHHTHSTKNPWVDLFLSPQGAHNHLTHHPLDYLVGAPGNPTTCPP